MAKHTWAEIYFSHYKNGINKFSTFGLQSKMIQTYLEPWLNNIHNLDTFALPI